MGDRFNQNNHIISLDQHGIKMVIQNRIMKTLITKHYKAEL